MDRPACAGGTIREGPRLPYLAGLDGLRALAVIAVLLYHAQSSWLSGGFLGVDVFFVISGYLITSLLLVERRQRGTVDLPAFWLRRARRLLPAVFLLIGVTLAFAIAFMPEEVAGLRNQSAAALVYVTNWYLIFHRTSYFETLGPPPLLQHLWSLAVEEQFYILWPPLFVLMMRFWKPRYVVPVVLAGAVASAVAMALHYQPYAENSRLYYGTDTRCVGLLVGVTLAFVWGPGRMDGRIGKISGLLLDAIGFGALALLAYLFAQLDGFQPFLYQGGFPLVALTAAALIAVAVHPRARLVRALLGLPPLRWVGLRSYGIYLWHWPIFIIAQYHFHVSFDGLRFLEPLAVTVLVAEISYRLVERPIRTGALGRIWASLRTGSPSHLRPWLQWGAIAGATVLAFGMLGRTAVSAHSPATPEYLSTKAVHIVATGVPGGVVPTAVLPSPTPVVPPSARAVVPSPTPPQPSSEPLKDVQASQKQPPPSAVAPAPEPLPTPASPVTVPPVHVTAIGDSVMVGAADQLVQAIGDIDIDAEVGREAWEVVNIVRERDPATLGQIVVIHIGNNGQFLASEFDQIMQSLGGTRRVVFVNLKVTRRLGSCGQPDARHECRPLSQRQARGLARGERQPAAVLL